MTKLDLRRTALVPGSSFGSEPDDFSGRTVAVATVLPESRADCPESVPGSAGILRKSSKLAKKTDTGTSVRMGQGVFIPLIISLVLIVMVLVVFAYLRVSHAKG